MKLRTNLLFLFIVCALNVSCYGMNLGERMTEACANRARSNNTGGFQGCKNKEVCGFDGFYLARYSPDGLCDNCNFKEHPERFVACLFCRKPQLKISQEFQSRSCLNCRAKAEELIAGKIATKDGWSNQHNLEVALNYYFKEISTQTINRNFITQFNNYRTHDLTFDDKSPYFYKGVFKKENSTKVHIWTSNLDIAEEDRIAVTRETAEAHVAYICEKYNVFGPETGEEILLEIPKNTSAMYQEKK